MDVFILVKKFIKQIPGVYKIRRSRAKKYFLSPQGYASEYGVFRNFAEAREFLPQSKEFNVENFEDEYVNLRTKRIFSYDYPVLFWLTKAFESGAQNVFDIGGSVGVHYFAYKKYINYPTGLQWHIYEVDSIVDKGRQLAKSENADVLSFTKSLNLKKKIQIFGFLQVLFTTSKMHLA